MASARKRKTIIIIIIAVILAALIALCIVMLHSSLEYAVMSNTEQLKAQLQREYGVSPNQLLEKIEVRRPWYSLSPLKWTFLVTFSSDSETVAYRRTDGGFEPVR